MFVKFTLGIRQTIEHSVFGNFCQKCAERGASVHDYGKTDQGPVYLYLPSMGSNTSAQANKDKANIKVGQAVNTQQGGCC
jgi:hypothetical protein